MKKDDRFFTPEIIIFIIIFSVMLILLIFVGVQFFINLSEAGELAKRGGAAYIIGGALFFITLSLMISLVAVVCTSRAKLLNLKKSAAANLTELTVGEGKPSEAGEIADFYGEVIDYISDKGNFPCWEKGVYPALPFVSESIEKGSMFVVRRADKIVGAFTLSQNSEKAYSLGRWQKNLKDDEFAVIHALAVHPDYQGEGLAKHMLRFAIKRAEQSGFKAVRADCTLLNAPAMHLFEALGFKACGAFDLGRGIKGAKLFQLYELTLDGGR